MRPRIGSTRSQGIETEFIIITIGFGLGARIGSARAKGIETFANTIVAVTAEAISRNGFARSTRRMVRSTRDDAVFLCRLMTPPRVRLVAETRLVQK